MFVHFKYPCLWCPIFILIRISSVGSRVVNLIDTKGSVINILEVRIYTSNVSPYKGCSLYRSPDNLKFDTDNGSIKSERHGPFVVHSFFSDKDRSF